MRLQIAETRRRYQAITESFACRDVHGWRDLASAKAAFRISLNPVASNEPTPCPPRNSATNSVLAIPRTSNSYRSGVQSSFVVSPFGERSPETRRITPVLVAF